MADDTYQKWYIEIKQNIAIRNKHMLCVISLGAHSQQISLPKLPSTRLVARGIPQRLATRWPAGEREYWRYNYPTPLLNVTHVWGKSFVFTASSAYISQVCAPITSKGSPTPGDMAFFCPAALRALQGPSQQSERPNSYI